MSQPKVAKLGEPIEVAWWVPALCLPPLLLCVAAVFISTPFWARAVAIIPSLGLMYAIWHVALGVKSQNMQSVWISLAFGIWAVSPITYLAAVIASH